VRANGNDVIRSREHQGALVDWENARVAPVSGSSFLLTVPLALERRPAELMHDMLPAVGAALGFPASWTWRVEPAAPPMVAIGADVVPGSLSLEGEDLPGRLDAEAFRRQVDAAAAEARRMIDALSSGEMARADRFRERLRRWG
jgi:hypothetical protein